MPLLSVIVPVFNESTTVRDILEKIIAVPVDKEIIVVDNASTDGTTKILREIKYPQIKIIHHITNRGKGGAVLTGLSNATGEYAIIQDGDLEYDPNDYLKLLDAARAGSADLILGARFLQGHQGLFMHRMGNKVLTALLNMLFQTKINDYATCYKLARKTTYDALQLQAKGFNLEAEIICNALKRRMRIIEVPIAYYPRTYKAGKKIRWWDGIWAMYYLIKYRLSP